jgi:hypothetical protein
LTLSNQNLSIHEKNFFSQAYRYSPLLHLQNTALKSKIDTKAASLESKVISWKRLSSKSELEIDEFKTAEKLLHICAV